jgi:large subunit ribosomal protein L30
MICILRVRGSIGVRRDVKEAMRFMHLTRVNHCVVTNMNPTLEGALHKVKDYVTWGEISTETLAKLIEDRGKRAGNIPITREFLKEHGFEDFLSLAKAMENGDTLDGMKPVFRLSPPRKGYENTKRSFAEGGSLGRRENMDELINRMV